MHLYQLFACLALISSAFVCVTPLCLLFYCFILLFGPLSFTNDALVFCTQYDMSPWDGSGQVATAEFVPVPEAGGCDEVEAACTTQKPLRQLVCIVAQKSVTEFILFHKLIQVQKEHQSDELHRLQAQLEAKEAALNRLQADLDAKEKDFAQRLMNVEAQLSAVETGKDLRESYLADLEADLESKAEDTLQLQRRICSLETVVDAREREVEQLRDRVTDLKKTGGPLSKVLSRSLPALAPSAPGAFCKDCNAA